MSMDEPQGEIMPNNWTLAFFGYNLDILLYGILTVQTSYQFYTPHPIPEDLYYLGFPNDKPSTKAIVLFVFALGTSQTAFALHDFYTLFSMGPEVQVMDLRWSGYMWFVVPISSALVAAVAQLFYAHRIYTISKNKFISILVIVLAFIQLCCGILTALISYSYLAVIEVALPIDFIGRIIDALAWESVGAICDLLIAIYMFRFLSIRIRQSFRTMRMSLTKIKRLVLETGLLTTIAAITYVILSYTSPYGFIIPGLSISKIYSNSILVLLNNRFTIPGGRNNLDSELEFDQLTTHQLQTVEFQGIPLEHLNGVGVGRLREEV